MDHVIEKLGLYEFFASFMTGAYTVLLYVLLDFPIPSSLALPSSDLLNGICLFFICYFIGFIIHILASLLEQCPLFSFRKTASATFLLQDNSVFKNKAECLTMQTFAISYLGVEEQFSFDEDVCEHLFYQWKTCLEVHDKSNKIDAINNIYAMSMSLMSATLGLLLCYVFVHLQDMSFHHFIMIASNFFLFALLCYKTKQYAYYKVRVVAREFQLYHKEETH